MASEKPSFADFLGTMSLSRPAGFCNIKSCSEEATSCWPRRCAFHSVYPNSKTAKLVHHVLSEEDWPFANPCSKLEVALQTYLQNHRELQGKTTTAYELIQKMGNSCPYASGKIGHKTCLKMILLLCLRFCFFLCSKRAVKGTSPFPMRVWHQNTSLPQQISVQAKF